MEYEYLFLDVRDGETVLAEISSPSPLPHIAAGHFIMLEAANYSMKAGHTLEICKVETYLFAPVDRAPATRIRTGVYVRLQDRAVLKQG